MAGFTLVPVERVSLGVHETSWDQAGQQRQRQHRPVKYAARRRLIQAVAPDHDPEACEVLAELGPNGELEGVVIRDGVSGAIIARLTVAQFTRLSADSDQRGLLFERRG